MDILSLINPQLGAQAKDEALTMGGLQAIAQLLAASGPQAKPVGTGQVVGSALLGGFQGYQSSMDRSLQELMTGVKIKESMGGKSPELSKEQQQYSFNKYGTVKFSELPKAAQSDVLEFGQTPDINKALEQYISAQKLFADTNIDVRDIALENLKKAQRIAQKTDGSSATVTPPTIRDFKGK